MEYQYKLNAEQYVLHDGDQPIGPVLDTVAIAFDKVSGTLHKHGAPAMVSAWLTKAQAKFRASGFDQYADDLAMIEGRFALDDLNHCLACTGFVGKLYARLTQGTLEHLSYGPVSTTKELN